MTHAPTGRFWSTPWMTRQAMNHPKGFLGLILLAVGMASLGFFRLSVDTDPENMLPADEPVRVLHREAKERFQLHDALVVGIVRDDPAGIYSPPVLGRLAKLTRDIVAMDGVIEKDVLSLATVDDVRADGPGGVRFSWLMRPPPTTSEGAAELRGAVERLPLFQDSLVSRDGKAAAIFVPVENKSLSHSIAERIRSVLPQGSSSERYFITGLPVAEDTFGVEMFVQMGLSAPLAALVIVLVLWFFFRNAGLIASPMLLSLASVILTMGALTGAGLPLHIMSSMIPIFLMPIAVVDSVHVLSEFKDEYPKVGDVRQTLENVMGRLYRPMFFTSLTSAVGFGSLALTPIPPVRVFGLFVSLGIVLAFLLTLTLLPAYLVWLKPQRLETILRAKTRGEDGFLARAVRALGSVARRKSGMVLVIFLGLTGVVAAGIFRLRINDNPIRWFSEDHPIAVSDRVLNTHFAGTYRTYLVLDAPREPDVEEPTSEATRRALESASPAVRSGWARLWESKRRVPSEQRKGWLVSRLQEAVEHAELEDIESWEELLSLVEERKLRDRVFYDPEVLVALTGLQESLLESGLVGKATSVADVVQTVHRELMGGGDEHYRIPDGPRAVGEVLVQYRSSHRPDDLSHLMTPDAQHAVVWLQSRSGDNLDISAISGFVSDYLRENPLPRGIRASWAGLPHVNVVWQQQMVRGMLEALSSSFVLVLLMMTLLFRSLRYGLLAMLPLSVTLCLIYGALGWLGKDYDMPVAVLSSLALGLSVDFAIHFLERARRLSAQSGDWNGVVVDMFEEPARAITRNLFVIAIGFTPLLLAPLVPYVTVGVLMAAIMILSALATLLLLPALLVSMRPSPRSAHEASAVEVLSPRTSGVCK